MIKRICHYGSECWSLKYPHKQLCIITATLEIGVVNHGGPHVAPQTHCADAVVSEIAPDVLYHAAIDRAPREV